MLVNMPLTPQTRKKILGFKIPFKLLYTDILVSQASSTLIASSHMLTRYNNPLANICPWDYQTAQMVYEGPLACIKANVRNKWNAIIEN